MGTAYGRKYSYSIDTVLGEVPDLLKGLKDKHGDKLSVGDHWDESPSNSGSPQGIECAKILVEGKEVGVYKRYWNIDGAYKHEYNGMPVN